MDQPSVLIRYMDLFHPIDVPEGRNRYAYFAEEARAITERLGWEDRHRSHFEVRYGGRTFYVYIRSPHLPLEHGEWAAGLEVRRRTSSALACRTWTAHGCGSTTCPG